MRTLLGSLARRLCLGFVVFAGLGCAVPTGALDAGREGGLADGATQACQQDRDCDDQLFCNGVERCRPGSAASNARGCVAGSPPCAVSSACDEALARCAPSDAGPLSACDEDGDGVRSVACGGPDCDDHDPYRNPLQREQCEGNLPDGRPARAHDEDCNPCTVAGAAPDGDEDADGYASSACTNAWSGAAAPVGCNARLLVDARTATVQGRDCNDDPLHAGAQQSPGLPEVCGNVVDDNCDGNTDESPPVVLYRDMDNDGRGDGSGASGTTMMASLCAPPPGWVSNHDDCDDRRQQTFRGAPEQCDGLDNDCSLAGALAGGPDTSEDRDGDQRSAPGARCLGRGEPGALGSAFPKDDCDDEHATVSPAAPELCGNGVDDDCDGQVDNRAQRVCDDRDGDGHGDPSTRRTVLACSLPAGTVVLCDDCDDGPVLGASRAPGNPEFCDRVDNDCSTPASALATEEDLDGDGYAGLGAACVGRGEAGAPATALPRTDCRDTDPAVHPGAAESCDRVDSDCSTGGGVALEEDQDNDGYAAPGAACLGRGDVGASSAALPRTDCDDHAVRVNPGATEDLSDCDGLDNDCNPLTTELTVPCASGGACVAGGRCARVSLAVQVVLGPTFSCRLLANGTAYCQGDNNLGQLGDGTTTDRASPVPVRGLTGAVELAAGQYHVCARLTDGTVRCWGDNRLGQLGDGTTFSRSQPVAVQGLTNAVQLALRGDHSCARTADGRVRCWGDNSSGQLGDGTTANRRVASVVPGLSGVAHLAAGENHTCACLTDGTARCWGNNTGGQLGDGTTTRRASPTTVVGLASAVELAAGVGHTCARLADGTARCWGSNFVGALGDGTTRDRTSPVAVTGLADVVELAVGVDHSCARNASGLVFCWGGGGSLGDGGRSSQPSPTRVLGLTAAVQLTVAGTSSCARRADDTVSCWGGNGLGQLGDGTTDTALAPTQMLALLRVQGLSAGFEHTCAWLLDGTATCWGGNTFGQLGDGTLGASNFPVAVSGLSSAVEVAVGNAHSCARQASGAVLCWGSNGYGQLGDGTTTSALAPGSVPVVADAVQLSAGEEHNCARRADGTAVCWGYNIAGQLGDGTTTNRTRPTVVSGLSSVAQLAALRWHSCARHTDGALSCWGFNSHGELGDGTLSTRPTPTLLAGFAQVVDVAGGFGHTCAARADGTVSCWGLNSFGELGDGTTTDRSRPTLVAGLAGAVRVAAGFESTSSCAWRDDGTAACWGNNNAGQLGDGTTTNRSRPVTVLGLTGVLEVVTGGNHACARCADGAVYCWGSNASGRLGDHGSANRSTPAVILDL